MIACLAGCSGTPVGVTVDLISDWVPGLDFVAVETEISSEAFDVGSAAEVRQASLTVTGTERFLRGARVAELDDVGTGRRFVRVRLLDATGRAIATRILDLTLERSFAVTLLVTRSCRDVECPAPAGAPELSECQAGTCVDPRCSPSSPEFCPGPACETDVDCITLIEWCDGARICGSSGHCLCADAPDVPDAGPDTGGCTSSEVTCSDGLDDDCDGLTDCADPDCTGSACDDGFYCTNNDTCGADLACSDTEPTCPTFCNESTMGCDECTSDTDCGSATTGAWGSCGGFAGTCGESGTRTRMVMTPTCAAGMCMVQTTTDTEACARYTDGTACMPTMNGSWGGCGGYSNVCDTTGTQSRTVTTHTCVSGSCASSAAPESRGCTRSTNGASCNDGNACTGPDRCSGGTCSDTPAMAEHSTCGSSNLRCCGSSCVDIRSDTNNCGGCGLRCNAGFACLSRGGLPTCDCNTFNSDCSGSTNHCSGMSSLCSCDSMFGGVCPGPMRCYAMSLGADVCTY